MAAEERLGRNGALVAQGCCRSTDRLLLPLGPEAGT